MPSTNDSPDEFTPARPLLAATLIFVAAALTLCWPMFTGEFLAGQWSDQFEAGYSFRHFAATYFREHGSIPLWNPYLFAGLPFVGAAHGDIFYPTAWLRWFLPTDVGMNIGFALHIIVAGAAMYGLLRTLRLGWAGAVVGGLGYELTGIVASLVHPGHDGKLFVAALAPVLLAGIVRAVRDRDTTGYGMIALATGLSLHGHPQASYYLLVAGAVWGLFWVFGPEGPAGQARLAVIAGAVGAVVLGIGVYAVYALPMAEYVAYSPRADGGYNTGWEHATSFALPVEELLGLFVPQIDGGPGTPYFGRNGIKLHTEYLGPVVLALAAFGIGGRLERRTKVALGVIGALFLLVSLGAATPFFRLWYTIMPMTAKLRAPGMAFFLVALVTACFAGLGADRLFRRDFTAVRAPWVVLGIGAFLGLLGVIGILQTVAEDIARSIGYQGLLEQAIAGAGALRMDAVRLLVVSVAAGAVIWAVARRSVEGRVAVALLAFVTVVDLWLVDRRYFVWSPPARVTYAADPIMQRLQATPFPYRVYSPAAPGQLAALNPYPRSWLMAGGIPSLFGYHGNEIRFFDDVLGGKNLWEHQLSANMWDLFAVKYIVLNQPQDIPGYTQVLGPVETFHGPGILYEADSAPPYARVIAGAALLPDSALAAAVSDPRYPVDRLVVYPDTASVRPASLEGQIPEPSALRATVHDWREGHMRVSIEGQSAATEYLVVAENWYKDWTAAIDGAPATVLRGQGTLLSVALPPGARDVVFHFTSPAYQRGRLISVVSLLGIAGIFAVPLVRRRRSADG